MSAVETLAAANPVESPAPPGTRLRWRRPLVAVLLGTSCALAMESAWVLVGSNHHTVLPGEVFRSAQLDPSTLTAIIHRDGIRTVINLRGCCEDADWYHEEVRVLAELGVKQRDITLSSYLPPNVVQLRKLIQALEESEPPILLHCRRGSDRTGLAAGLALLLRSAADVPEARRQLSWRYGHFAISQTGKLERLLDMYENWLATNGETHRFALLRQWALTAYRPAHCWARIEPLDVPSRLPFGRPVAARFRVTNCSGQPWTFRKQSNAGVHLRYSIAKPEAIKEREGGAGFFDATLAPGESIDLTLALPALRDPGRYRLVVDMYDCKMGWFNPYGSRKFESELDVDHE